ncbi:hypothetical protein J4408_02970 [Candidatus Pacearchaeota archaeon]|nr:hypothetical protein [Candidatus Pacearchaeota archaeon]
MSSDTIIISKKSLMTLIGVVIIIVLAVYFYTSYYSTQKETSEINFYKAALYKSISCQYSCPLIEQEFQNKTQFLPSRSCVEGCITELNALNLSSTKFSNEKLLGDNLIPDIENVINNCKKINLEQNDTENKIFFSCSVNGLNALKLNYTYIN